jgi:hypothetical protein
VTAIGNTRRKTPRTVRWMWPIVVTAACGLPTWESAVQPADGPVPMDRGDDRWLKVHMQSGDLYVLDSWQPDTSAAVVSGSGVRFDMERAPTGSGSFSIPVDSIALLETNDKEVVGEFALVGLSVYTALSAGVTALCLADPKACFGSCPTFYATEDADRPLAEGFSSSFARTLEARDVDGLGLSAAPGPVSLVMRNEAQETHAVRHVRLLAVDPASAGDVVLTGDGDAVRVGERGTATRCRSLGGDCLAELRERDDVEYEPRTDPSDLAKREEVVLDFGAVSGRVGLVLTARHSLVSTYVFYQSLAYAGTATGDLLAQLEKGIPGAKARVRGVADALGPIEVLVRADDGPWVPAGTFDEAGPIAADRQLVRLGSFETERLRVMLRMAQGAWRVDEAVIVPTGAVVPAVVLEPDSVELLAGSPRDALAALRDPDAHLVTTQGDAFRLWFTVPEGAERRLFLDTRGYYYEWMRESWLEEEDALMTATVLHRPREALRLLAPGFKEREAEMERLFWDSRFRR